MLVSLRRLGSLRRLVQSAFVGLALVSAAAAPAVADGPNELQQAKPAPAQGNATHIASVSVYAGDSQAEVRGSGLAQVATVTVAGVEFSPGDVRPAKKTNGTEELQVTAQSTIVLKVGRSVGVDVIFKDGRLVHLDVTVQPPRPLAELVSKSVEGAPNNGISMANANDVPQGATLVFTARLAKGGEPTAIEVAFEDDSRSIELTAANGGLSGLTGRLSPAKAFGPAAFGPLKFRVFEGDASSDWVPLALLVRVPHLTGLTCPADPSQQCTLSGSSLFFIESIAADTSYQQSVNVPARFQGSQIQVPYPAESGMVVRLVDDVTAMNPVTLAGAVAAAAKSAPQP